MFLSDLPLIINWERPEIIRRCININKIIFFSSSEEKIIFRKVV